MLAPAANVVPQEPTFNFNVSSTVRAWVGGVIVPITEAGGLVMSGSDDGVIGAVGANGSVTE